MLMVEPLEKRLREISAEGMADYFGIADLGPAKDAIPLQGGEWLRPYDRAVVVGIRMFDDLVDKLPEHDKAVAIDYRHHCYEILNLRLDQIVSRLAGEVQSQGHAAVPVPASKRYDDERICAMFSHKMAAHLAGLGWIGKSCMLITPDHGPRVRWASLLTNAPLTATGSAMPPKCGECRECVDACPVKAFTGRAFVVTEPREARFDARKCEVYFDELEAKGGPGVCGMCVAVCPRGRAKPRPK
ncbi:MAG: 4Fe-4S dicluster domain-containing protein [Methanomassiliicoccales archaeon]|nr:4Fe-4S dicluster domain-containing protein [Methanomassiliicoccales archaeon]